MGLAGSSNTAKELSNLHIGIGSIGTEGKGRINLLVPMLKEIDEVIGSLPQVSFLVNLGIGNK